MASLTRSTIARSTRSRSSVEDTVLMIWYRYRLSTVRAGPSSLDTVDVCETDISTIVPACLRRAVSELSGRMPQEVAWLT